MNRPIPYARGNHHAGVFVGGGGTLAAAWEAPHRAHPCPAVTGAAEALHGAGGGEADGHGAAATVADAARAHEDARLAVAPVARRAVAASARTLRTDKRGLCSADSLSPDIIGRSSHLRVYALHPGTLAAAAVVHEALVDVVAVEPVSGPPDGAVAALQRTKGSDSSFSSRNGSIAKPERS